MKQAVAASVLTSILFTVPGLTFAQSPPPGSGEVAAPGALVLPQPGDPRGFIFDQPKPLNPFTSIGKDVKSFFSMDTARVMGLVGAAVALASTQDSSWVVESQEHLQPAGRFKAGNIGGSFLVQTSAAIGTFAIGKATGSAKATAVGSDLIRGQIVSQVVVQGLKFATHRARPDGSDRQSFPSGHTASAFTTATVLQRHFGWKIGAPAYAFATYVGASRMSANKHHLTDVLMGAGIGFAAGRTVTVGVGRTKFDLGVAPTTGGAAVTFTRR
jgi:PAP2 superfamily